ncbi:PREDICTED: uncharacterized protein LOC109154352 isoform X2 [Ipomoea nil]|uniref:uncharacterized protein LOC109154352 isoform X2 n=1 Tax=Ipomoea nil TaxID=35883 RepID=UPI000900E52E|nr:PREDICTED: uncharacterized protein LOC109154352 isoform X2 [Ipomoea nil]
MTLHYPIYKLIGHNSTRCPQQRKNMAVANGEIAANMAAAPAEVPVNVVAAPDEIPINVVASLDENLVNVAELKSLPAKDTQDVGLHGIQGEGMKITSHVVKINFGRPLKRRKTIAHASKGKQVDEYAPPSNAKTHKSLGMTKTNTAKGRKYMMRSSTMLRSKYCLNEKTPIDID